MSTERVRIDKKGRKIVLKGGALKARMAIEKANQEQGLKDQAKKDYIAIKKNTPVSCGGRNYLFSERLRADFLQQINLDEIDTIDAVGNIVTLTPLEAVKVQKEMKRVIKEAHTKFKAV